MRADVFKRFFQVIARTPEPAPAQVNHNPHIQFLHELYPLAQVSRVHIEIVIMNIDERKFCTRYLMLRHHQRGGRVVIFEIHFHVERLFLCANTNDCCKKREEKYSVTDHAEIFCDKIHTNQHNNG